MITTCLLCMLTVGLTNPFEFDKDSCDTLLPNQKLHPVDNGRRHTDHDDNHYRGLIEDEDEDEGEDKTVFNDQDYSSERGSNFQYKLKPANSPSPYTISVSSNHYRRNRPLTVSITGSMEFNGFILLAKPAYSKKPHPVGTFFSLPPIAKHLHCTSLHDGVINKDTGGKMNLRLNWKAPSEDKGNILFHFGECTMGHSSVNASIGQSSWPGSSGYHNKCCPLRATVVQKDIFWPNIKSDEIKFRQFPPSFSGCGESKSCYRYSTKIPNCEPDECDYVVITRIIDGIEIEFIIGGVIEEQRGYIAIGFTLDNEKMTHMDIGACVKNGDLIQTKRYTIHKWNETPHESNKVFTEEDVDKDGKMIWCQYRRPLRGPGHGTIDFTHSLHHAFIWGPLNLSTNLPQLSSVANVKFIAEPWNYSNTINMIHFVGGKATPTSVVQFGSLLITLLSFYILSYFLVS